MIKRGQIQAIVREHGEVWLRYDIIDDRVILNHSYSNYLVEKELTMKMKVAFLFYCGLLLPVLLPSISLKASPSVDTLHISGLRNPVEIIKDRWGISHIYAQNQADLFFAQGYNAACDRIFQLEIWRRRALGLLAEIQGNKGLKHDIGVRLLKFRKDLNQEMDHYHPDGKEIITSFVKGINAYIDLTRERPEMLPIEFELLGIIPGYWTPEVVVSRHNGLFYGLRNEIDVARSVHLLGAEKTKKLFLFQNGDPDLFPKDGLDITAIENRILEIYNASRRPPSFTSDDIDTPADENLLEEFNFMDDYINTIGSNNWVLGGEKTSSGFPIMANDPHRSLQVPSLRYWVHLVAPGWNVIGGGEPALPGISIGHNEYGAWGLTIFRIDQEDLYVYDTNPDNPDQYRYLEGWKEMDIIEDTIPLKGEKPVTEKLKYTLHGPVIYQDVEKSKAYAIRAAWLEIGSAPYLASLRMDQVKNWEEFRDACSYSGTPPENMVWADKNGNIGWQAVGLTPQRFGYDGMLPVPGDGRFEWKDFLPIKSLPHIYNPTAGYFASANQNNVPLNYPDHIGFIWTPPFRFQRINEVIQSSGNMTIRDNINLQLDELSIPARMLVPLLKELKSDKKQVKQAIEQLLAWDYILNRGSISAAIYATWETVMRKDLPELLLPEAQNISSTFSMTQMVQWLNTPDCCFGMNPIKARDLFLLESIENAVHILNEKLGSDMQKWQYGQERFHHCTLNHILSNPVNPAMQERLNIGPVPRGGNSFTLNNTSNVDNQRSGATFRIIVDTGNWDNSVGMNSPGQSGDPDNKHYDDLFKMWADGEYFPVYYSRDKIETAAESKTVLKSVK